ncbi:MAG: hypothetical protein RBT49_04650, partial [Bacteroidales bacterium]|nr:hypothetical protein [Bacteroidales bacterium]
MVQRFLNEFSCVLALLLLSLTISAQEPKKTEFDELKQAHLEFKNKDFNKAYGYFQKMYEQYPKDPTYNYYTGVCLLFIDKNSEKGLKRLRLAATNDVPDDVYFYLGLAYHNSYLFDDALKNYYWFEKKASKKKANEYDLQNYINKTLNAKSLTAVYVNPTIITKELASKNKFVNQYEVPALDGKFSLKAPSFNNHPDSTAKFTAMYMPNNPERNEIVYYTIRNEKRGDLDIYKSTRKADGTWSEPENVGDIINTPYDDNFPYLHSDGSTFYFASKGHYSMGGYDIYKTVWSWEKKQWSKPENIGFPINSPFDDFFFVPSPDEKFIYFTSTRDCSVDESYVFKINFTNDNSPLNQVAYNDLINHAKLTISTTEKGENKSEKNNKSKPTQNEIVKLESKENFILKNEYDSLLNEAMKYQLKADSMKWVIDSKRSQLSEAQTNEQQQKLSKEILQLETNIYSTQKIADQLYGRVREIEQLNLASKTTRYEVKPEKTDLEQSIKNLPKNNAEIKNNSLSDSIILKPIIQPKEDDLGIEEKSTTDFYIKTPSIYNAKNPIPTNERLPKGIVYMIQLGAFTASKNPESFHGFTPITCITKQGTNLRKYYTGRFLTLKDAEKVLPKIKNKGFKDAYIVAFNSGKLIPVNDAIKLGSRKPTESSTNKVQPVIQDESQELSIQYALKFEINSQDSVLLDKMKPHIPENAKTNQVVKGNIIFISIDWFTSFDEAYKIKKNLEPIVNKEVEIHAFFDEIKIPL